MASPRPPSTANGLHSEELGRHGGVPGRVTLSPTGPWWNASGGGVADAVVPGGFEPGTPDAPEEYSPGTRPTKELVVFPAEWRQSPISRASANAVRVDTPRRHASRRTTGVNSLSVANSAIAVSSRARRAATASTASKSDSKVVVVARVVSTPARTGSLKSRCRYGAARAGLRLRR